ncbi:MAG: 1,4-dihydroxy-2-naphthoate octaprenyltransferase [Mangrovibacterium sp.]
MATLQSWIRASRLRTLPLALSGILTGCALAASTGTARPGVSLLAVLTATGIQIFSNFANDYGDSIKGTDTARRVGPQRTVQSGEISLREMRKGMTVAGTLRIVLGTALVSTATLPGSPRTFAWFMALGLLSLTAAYFYVAGRYSYGYIGLGDPAVFLFFGLLPVAGIFFLNTGSMDPAVLLPAVSIGLFSTGVLNVNNMRDAENDRHSGKMTIPVRLGKRLSRIYHLLLILGGWLAALSFTLLKTQGGWAWIYLFILPLFAADLYQILRKADKARLDPFLKRLSLSTLAFSLLFGAGLLLSR